jgi:hypothetical protein
VSIYVSIASYEDPFLERTVKSAIDNALYPENLYFGIAVQNEKIKIPDFSFIKTENLSLLNLNAKNRPGVVRIRYILRKLMRNQDYFLQIDSHMFFEKNWDINLIKKFNELKQITGKPDFYKFLFNSKNTRFYIHDVQRTFKDFCIELGLDFYFIKNNYYKYLKDNNIKE